MNTQNFTPSEFEKLRYTIQVLELEKAQHKLRAKTLALKLSRAEVLIKRMREAGKPLE
jgi:predicted alpha/beta-hydrolase family hydrolase